MGSSTVGERRSPKDTSTRSLVKWMCWKSQVLRMQWKKWPSDIDGASGDDDEYWHVWNG